MIVSTNLARRPFRNERLPWLLAWSLTVGALVASFFHVRFVSDLLSRDETGTVAAVREDEARIAELEARLNAEPPVKIESVERARLLAFKDLVDRRIFPWRRLLAELETTLSDDVRLTRISPATSRDGSGVLIQLSGEARNKNAAFSLAEGLEASPAFSMTALKSLAEVEGSVEFDIEMAFDPGPVSASLPASAPAPGDPS